jgi:UDP-N-acetylglucosamine--N-acetylmuramyl-(pentapeptide) pyrophosphoryl-undecaprenol N-acetylglucosamine transferase
MAAKRLVIMAAGTGGHIFPGLAIAATMQKEGWEVTWLGTNHGMEGRIVPEHGIALDTVDFAGLRGKGLGHMISGGFKLIGAFLSCLGIMGRRKPDLVVGMGGYVTVPGGMAAKMKGIPVVVVNADAALLLSNKALASSARYVLFGFPGNYGDVASKAVCTGNPVREEIKAVSVPSERYPSRTGRLRILLVGGSLGAQALNECMPKALALLPEEKRPEVIHQTGRQHIAGTKEHYAAAGVQAQVLDFIDNMGERYAEADLVICRAGAITVSELTVAGVASILVPFIASSTSHQRDNAVFMDAEGAAIHLPQKEMTPQRLAELIEGMTREKCYAMAQKAYALGRRDANEAIAAILKKVAGGNEK